MLQQAFYVLLQQSIAVQNVCFMSIMSNSQVFYENACLMFFAQGVSSDSVTPLLPRLHALF